MFGRLPLKSKFLLSQTPDWPWQPAEFHEKQWHANKHSSLWSTGKRNVKPCPLLSLSISVQAPLDTQELLGLAFVGHLSLLLSSTSLLQSGSLKWEITLRITSVWNMSLSNNGKWCCSGSVRRVHNTTPSWSLVVSPKGQRESRGTQRRVTGLSSVTKHLFSAIACKEQRSSVAPQTQRQLQSGSAGAAVMELRRSDSCCVREIVTGNKKFYSSVVLKWNKNIQ